MQLPKTSKDLLILAPSIILIPLLVVLFALYEPAKSTKQNLPEFVSSLMACTFYFVSTFTIKIA